MKTWKEIEQIEVQDKESAIEKYEAIQKYLYGDDDFYIEGEINILFNEIFNLIEDSDNETI